VKSSLDIITGRVISIEEKINSLILVRDGEISVTEQPRVESQVAEVEAEVEVSSEIEADTEANEEVEAVESVLLSPAEARTSNPSHISVRSPPRFRCQDPSCAYSCHLNRNYKTPRFLRDFIGALKFRGTCRNHPTNLWEVKYWMPWWMANYNVYLLFERTASGSPSLGLRFRRRVDLAEPLLYCSFKSNIQGLKMVLQNPVVSLDDIHLNTGYTALHVSKTLPLQIRKCLVECVAKPSQRLLLTHDGISWPYRQAT
jgi:hypothetical protein